MFTGIISEVGKVVKTSRNKDIIKLGVTCDKIYNGLKIGDSVALNGACLSVTGLDGFVSFDVVANTLDKTNLLSLKTGDIVNLENSLKVGDTLGGHFVSGHIDGTRRVKFNGNSDNGWAIDIDMIKDDRDFVIPRGSIAVDGVSLTVGEVYGGFLRIFLIPLTLENTILKSRKAGDRVNIEFDIIAKYAKNWYRGVAQLG